MTGKATTHGLACGLGITLSQGGSPGVGAAFLLADDSNGVARRVYADNSNGQQRLVTADKEIA